MDKSYPRPFLFEKVYNISATLTHDKHKVKIKAPE